MTTLDRSFRSVLLVCVCVTSVSCCFSLVIVIFGLEEASCVGLTIIFLVIPSSHNRNFQDQMEIHHQCLALSVLHVRNI